METLTVDGTSNATIGESTNCSMSYCTFCLMYNMESEVKKSYWGLFGSYQLGLGLLPMLASDIPVRICLVRSAVRIFGPNFMVRCCKKS